MFKVNDKVYCPLFGWGVVLDDSAGETYPILVEFSDRRESFTAEGKLIQHSPQPIVFHNEVEYVAVQPSFKPGEWVQVSDYLNFSESIAVRFSYIEDRLLVDTNGANWPYWKKLDLTTTNHLV